MEFGAPPAPDSAWDYENGFYLTSAPSRLGKALTQYELYKSIVGVPGDIFELGVYKGASLVRWLTFRSLLESQGSRRVWGFDAFGQFPKDRLLGDADLEFVRRFEAEGGDGYSADVIERFLRAKSFDSFELVEGDVFVTIPAHLATHPEQRIALLHLDLDAYEPTASALSWLADLVVPGGIIVLDDYGSVEGATRAVDEFCSRDGRSLEVLPFNRVPAFIRM